jgi:hypothetical protein
MDVAGLACPARDYAGAKGSCVKPVGGTPRPALLSDVPTGAMVDRRLVIRVTDRHDCGY